jgi:hypothetical protein
VAFRKGAAPGALGALRGRRGELGSSIAAKAKLTPNVAQAIPRSVQTREVAVYDGQVYLGRIVLLRGKTFRAFDASGHFLGDFQSAGDAYGACGGAR